MLSSQDSIRVYAQRQAPFPARTANTCQQLLGEIDDDEPSNNRSMVAPGRITEAGQP